MKLFNKTIDRELFKQYALGSDLAKQNVVVKIFNPVANGTWFILNSDPEDPDYLWAIVDLGYGAEVGSVSRSDLETYRGRFGMGFERDLSFDPVNALELYNGLSEGKYYAKGGAVDKQSIEEEIRSLNSRIKSLSEINTKEASEQVKELVNSRGALQARLLHIEDSYADGGSIKEPKNEKEFLSSLELSVLNVKEKYLELKRDVDALKKKANLLQGSYNAFWDSGIGIKEDKNKYDLAYSLYLKFDNAYYIISRNDFESDINKSIELISKISGKFADGGDIEKIKEGDKVVYKDNVYLVSKIEKRYVQGLYDVQYHLISYKRDLQNVVVDDVKFIKKFADGGELLDYSDNQLMVMNQNVEVEHHHEELEDILKEKTPVPAWVVAKMETATQNLSDITHYLDGEKELMEDENEDENEEEDEDQDEIENKIVVEPIDVSAGTKTDLTKNFTDEAWGNLRGFLKGMEGVDLRDDYTFDYKDEQYEVEPIINSDENGVSNAVFNIFDGDGEEVGDISYSREGGKQKFTANSEFFSWNNAKFEDGGYFDGTIPKVSTYMSTYAKGGSMNKHFWSWKYAPNDNSFKSVIIYKTDIDDENSYDSVEQIKEQLTKEGVNKFIEEDLKHFWSWKYAPNDNSFKSVIIYKTDIDDENSYDSVKQIKEQLVKEGVNKFIEEDEENYAKGGKIDNKDLEKLNAYWQSFYKGVMAGKKDEGYITITNKDELNKYITSKLGNVVKNIELIEKGKNYPYNDSYPYYEDIYSVELKNGTTFKIVRSYGRPRWQGNVDYKEQIIVENIKQYADGGNVEKPLTRFRVGESFRYKNNGSIIYTVTKVYNDGACEARDEEGDNYSFEFDELNELVKAENNYADGGFMSDVYAKGGMVVTSIKDIPNFKERLEQGKITYRGLGMGKLFDTFYDLAGTSGTRIKVDGKEYYITDKEFDTFSRGADGKMQIRFDAPARKGYADGGQVRTFDDIFGKTIIFKEEQVGKFTIGISSGFNNNRHVFIYEGEVGRYGARLPKDFTQSPQLSVEFANKFYSNLKRKVEYNQDLRPFELIKDVKFLFADGGFMNDVYADGGGLYKLLEYALLEENGNEEYIDNLPKYPEVLTVAFNKNGGHKIYKVYETTLNNGKFVKYPTYRIGRDMKPYSKLKYVLKALDKKVYDENFDNDNYAKGGDFDYQFYEVSASTKNGYDLYKINGIEEQDVFVDNYKTIKEANEAGQKLGLEKRPMWLRYGKGGKMSNFDKLSAKVAKNYEGKPVQGKYQEEYGKVYSKAEAKEVGDKVAGKVKAMQPAKKEMGGETKKGRGGSEMLKQANILAKKIRKDGESWNDAKKRAFAQLKK